MKGISCLLPQVLKKEEPLYHVLKQREVLISPLLVLILHLVWCLLFFCFFLKKQQFFHVFFGKIKAAFLLKLNGVSWFITRCLPCSHILLPQLQFTPGLWRGKFHMWICCFHQLERLFSGLPFVYNLQKNSVLPLRYLSVVHKYLIEGHSFSHVQCNLSVSNSKVLSAFPTLLACLNKRLL